MVADQFLVGMTTAGQFLKETTTTIRLIDLVLMVMVWSTLKSQENQKVKNWLSFENYISEKNPITKNRKNC